VQPLARVPEALPGDDESAAVEVEEGVADGARREPGARDQIAVGERSVGEEGEEALR